MHVTRFLPLASLSLLIAVGIVMAPTAAAKISPPGVAPLPDNSGEFQTLSTAGGVDTHNPFFLPEGSNGRACVSCHVQASGWSITPPELQQRFLRTNGTDP